MHTKTRKMRAGLVVAAVTAAQVCPAAAESGRTISGTYVCVYGCRVTDAAPSLQIEGNAAACTNELGGLYQGRMLTRTTLSCFNKTGAISADGRTIRWSDGVIWKRMPPPAR
jgi:hypothetical protein